jgi:hypothetical protein
MNYYVSIENTYYHHWQLELLIESFKYHNIQDKLFVGIAEGDGLFDKDYLKNLQSHPNKMCHENYGDEIGRKDVNLYCSLLSALEFSFLAPPVTLIHADMVLVKPLETPKDDIIFSVDDSFDHLRTEVEEYTNIPAWLPVGGVLTFNKDPIPLLNTIIARSQQVKHIKSAVMLGLYEHIYDNEVDGLPIETNLLHNEVESNFIHYNKGVPPHFSKRHYNVGSILGNPKGPFAALSELNSTTNLRYVNKIIDRY